ncbi:hypothetical protein EMN47_13555 [Prolixibacteraceae bacterium JC049]|nr:hypothetical protein [Prolixibacteraceae bacterium JC049]
MKTIAPFTDKTQALNELDNGGHFYNFLTKANDGLISSAELGKVGGIFNDKQQMILFLEMSVRKLNEADKRVIIASLDDNLQKAYKKYKSLELLPSEAKEQGIIASNAIITGIPRLIESKSEFNGYLMFPITNGNITSFMMIPMVNEYDVYELRDEESSETFLIAHAKADDKLPCKRITFGGVLKELNSEESGEGEKEKFLEIIYRIDI